MDSKGRTFQDIIRNERTYWVIRNEPNNEITGQFHSMPAAQKHALPGDVIYEVKETAVRTAVEIKGDYARP
jgi:hypothetical protein